MEEPSEPIQVIQHIRKMLGGSQAHLLRASDGHSYVVKFQNNPQGIRILANEYLATKLGTLLGLPMPEVRIISVSEWLIANSPELNVDLGAGRSVPCASGLQFASRFAADPEQDRVFDYLPQTILRRISNRRDFACVLALDKWLGNSDGRQAIFVKTPNRPLYSAIFIDQGHCFNAGEWSFQNSPLRGTFAQNSVYEQITGWHDFEPTLSGIEQIEFAELRSIANQIPSQWYQEDSEALSRLLQTLYERRLLVRQLILDFKESSRSPFPNWLGQ